MWWRGGRSRLGAEARPPWQQAWFCNWDKLAGTPKPFISFLDSGGASPRNRRQENQTKRGDASCRCCEWLCHERVVCASQADALLYTDRGFSSVRAAAERRARVSSFRGSFKSHAGGEQQIASQQWLGGHDDIISLACVPPDER